MKTVNIKGKEYVQVSERVKYFRTNYPEYSLETDVLEFFRGKTDEGKSLSHVMIKAIIKDETGRILSTGIALEYEGSSNINKTSHVENCETSAVGRALGNFGIGIDGGIASADEVFNAINNQ